MRFVFINLPSQELERPPAAASILTAIVKKNLGWQTKVFDFNLFLHSNVSITQWDELESFWRCRKDSLLEETHEVLKIVIEKFISHLEQFNPTVIAVSVFSRFSVVSSYKLVKELRARFTKTKIILGGHGITSWPGSLPYLKENKQYETIANLMLKENLIDHYVLGDAEESLIELLNGNTSYPGIDGRPPVSIKNLDNLPLPDYKDIKPLDYYYTTEPGVYITASKGCVRRCTFCNVPDLWPHFITRSAESLVSEIKKNKEQYGVNLTHFTDSLINGSMKHFRNFNEKMIELKESDPDMKDLKYFGQFICRRKKEQDEKDWSLMSKAGADMLVVGFESYSENVRSHMGKNYSNDDIKFHMEQSGYHGIKNVALMFVGYPVETKEDHEMNKKFLHDFQTYAKAGIIHMVRWGYTGMFRDKTKIEKPGKVELIIDPDFEGRFKSLPLGLRDIALGFGWINKLNPTLTLKERIKRRVELHELSVELGWPQTRSREELTILYNILKNLEKNKFEESDIDELDNLLDFH